MAAARQHLLHFVEFLPKNCLAEHSLMFNMRFFSDSLSIALFWSNMLENNSLTYNIAIFMFLQFKNYERSKNYENLLK